MSLKATEFSISTGQWRRQIINSLLIINVLMDSRFRFRFSGKLLWKKKRQTVRFFLEASRQIMRSHVLILVARSQHSVPGCSGTSVPGFIQLEQIRRKINSNRVKHARESDGIIKGELLISPRLPSPPFWIATTNFTTFCLSHVHFDRSSRPNWFRHKPRTCLFTTILPNLLKPLRHLLQTELEFCQSLFQFV